MAERHICEPIRDMKKVEEMIEALAMREHGFRDSLLFQLGLATAFRVSDLLSLKKKHITDGFVRYTTQKTDHYKMVALNDSCRRKVEAYIEHMDDEQLLFPIKRQWVHKMLKQAAEMVGLDKRYVSTHVMRKTSAYHFYHKTKDIVKTQELLGHKNSSETRKYLMINEEEVNKELVNMQWTAAMEKAKHSMAVDGFDTSNIHDELVLRCLKEMLSEGQFLEEVRKRISVGK